MSASKLYIRAAKIPQPPGWGSMVPVQWKWLVWLDENPPGRHWRDQCMEPTSTSTHVGLFDDWPAAWRAGVTAQRFANVHWRNVGNGGIEIVDG